MPYQHQPQQNDSWFIAQCDFQSIFGVLTSVCTTYNKLICSKQSDVLSQKWDVGDYYLLKDIFLRLPLKLRQSVRLDGLPLLVAERQAMPKYFRFKLQKLDWTLTEARSRMRLLDQTSSVLDRVAPNQTMDLTAFDHNQIYKWLELIDSEWMRISYRFTNGFSGTLFDDTGKDFIELLAVLNDGLSDEENLSELYNKFPKKREIFFTLAFRYAYESGAVTKMDINDLSFDDLVLKIVNANLPDQKSIFDFPGKNTKQLLTKNALFTLEQNLLRSECIALPKLEDGSPSAVMAMILSDFSLHTRTDQKHLAVNLTSFKSKQEIVKELYGGPIFPYFYRTMINPTFAPHVHSRLAKVGLRQNHFTSEELIASSGKAILTYLVISLGGMLCLKNGVFTYQMAMAMQPRVLAEMIRAQTKNAANASPSARFFLSDYSKRNESVEMRKSFDSRFGLVAVVAG